MSEKPQHLSSPAEVSRETSGPEKPTPTVEKNKPSSVYIYLVVLFGAAFLMLLLAYFVQQRNNAAELDNLRSTTSSSREELLEEIKTLEKKQEQLQESATRTMEQYQTVQELNRQYSEWLAEAGKQSDTARALGYLERFISEGDYLMAACAVEDCDPLFNQRNENYSDTYPPLPAQTARYLELRSRLEEDGHVVIYQFSVNEDGSNATERPVVSATLDENASQETLDTIMTAKKLWQIIFNYYNHTLVIPAIDIGIFCIPDRGDLERLNSGAFQPSTVELFEQIKADYMERGDLTEVDGVVTYAINGEPAPHVYGDRANITQDQGKR